MAGFCCDRCGKPLLVDEEVRYVANIEVFAAYDVMELTSDDLAGDRTDEIRDLVQQMRRMDPKELEDQVYQRITLDLCPACRKAFVKDPLGKEGARPADV